MNCNEYIVPIQIEDFCNGERGNIKCQFSEDAYTLLEIPANSSLDVILNAFVLALSSAFTTNSAQQIIIEDLEQRVYNLENP